MPEESGARARVLEAAEQIVQRLGSAHLTLDAVAAEAGISKGGLLYHFPNKEALIAAMIERLLESFETAIDARMQSDPGPGRFTRALLHATFPDFGAAVAARVSGGLLAAVAMNPALLDKLRARYEQWLASLATDGIDEATADLVALAIDGLWMREIFGLAMQPSERRRAVLARLEAMTRGEAGSRLSRRSGERGRRD